MAKTLKLPVVGLSPTDLPYWRMMSEQSPPPLTRDKHLDTTLKPVLEVAGPGWTLEEDGELEEGDPADDAFLDARDEEMSELEFEVNQWVDRAEVWEGLSKSERKTPPNRRQLEALRTSFAELSIRGRKRLNSWLEGEADPLFLDEIKAMLEWFDALEEDLAKY